MRACTGRAGQQAVVLGVDIEYNAARWCYKYQRRRAIVCQQSVNLNGQRQRKTDIGPFEERRREDVEGMDVWAISVENYDYEC